MVVSLEPVVHANILRNKHRIVIQDFYMCTPKHPFLKWLLEDRLTIYNDKLKGINNCIYYIV